MRPLWGLVAGTLCFCNGLYKLAVVLFTSGRLVSAEIFLFVISVCWMGAGWMLLSADQGRRHFGLGFAAVCIGLGFYGNLVLGWHVNRLIKKSTVAVNKTQQELADYYRAQKDMRVHDWERFAPSFAAAGLTPVLALYQSGQCKEGWNEFAQNRVGYERAAAGRFSDTQLLQLANTGKSICETHTPLGRAQ